MFGLPAAVVDTLRRAWPMLEAEDRLKAGVPDRELFDAVLAATADEDAAHEALYQRQAYRTRRGEQFEID